MSFIVCSYHTDSSVVLTAITSPVNLQLTLGSEYYFTYTTIVFTDLQGARHERDFCHPFLFDQLQEVKIPID